MHDLYCCRISSIASDAPVVRPTNETDVTSFELQQCPSTPPVGKLVKSIAKWASPSPKSLDFTRKLQSRPRRSSTVPSKANGLHLDRCHLHQCERAVRSFLPRPPIGAHQKPLARAEFGRFGLLPDKKVVASGWAKITFSRWQRKHLVLTSNRAYVICSG